LIVDVLECFVFIIYTEFAKILCEGMKDNRRTINGSNAITFIVIEYEDGMN
jgi:hypothetical protein